MAVSIFSRSASSVGGAAAQPEQTGPADERDVVVVHYVVIALIEERRDTTGVQDGPTQLLREDRGENTRTTAQPDDLNTLVIGDGLGLRAPMKGVVRIHIVHHGDMVPVTHERARKPLNADGVPAKRIRRIERREHAEAQWPPSARHGRFARDWSRLKL